MAKKIKRKNSNESTDTSETSETSDTSETNSSTEEKKDKPGILGNHFEVKVDAEDKWEIWSILSLALTAIALILLAISFLQLGKWSVLAWVDGLLYCGFATIVLGFFGLLRVLFRPPPIRRTRTIAFVCLLAVGTLGLSQPRFFSVPLSTSNWKSETPIRLPFDGPWVTIQGNDDQNYLKKMAMPPLKWTYVFTKAVDGKIYKKSDSPLKLSDYYCWDQPVLAPVSGEVVDFEKGIPDHEFGASAQANRASPLGNFVAIKFGKKDFIYVSGLKENSVSVKPGQKITAGSEIGRCGRSGYSLFPSVVMHGQNSIEFPYSEGLPILFSNIKINGKEVVSGTPSGGPYQSDLYEVSGDVVEISR